MRACSLFLFFAFTARAGNLENKKKDAAQKAKPKTVQYITIAKEPAASFSYGALVENACKFVCILPHEPLEEYSDESSASQEPFNSSLPTHLEKCLKEIETLTKLDILVEKKIELMKLCSILEKLRESIPTKKIRFALLRDVLVGLNEYAVVPFLKNHATMWASGSLRGIQNGVDMLNAENCTEKTLIDSMASVCAGFLSETIRERPNSIYTIQNPRLQDSIILLQHILTLHSLLLEMFSQHKKNHVKEQLAISQQASKSLQSAVDAMREKEATQSHSTA
ncbi:uncharacterized protein NEMAJ01_0466 [Nematocida major]|uniref:uncharacterized protein n=1 Tax=Nematocida major TaxID=1912982 RepID=UPI002008365E|nr:uncharacterized protein NEMAJ01_0466 [Nematocida major]KAH9385570.1 hypothetical protein NEMAJ01_0466 [Nematocida major]